MRKDIIAVKNCPIAIPESSKVLTGTLFFTLDIKYTKKVDVTDPIKAPIEILDIPKSAILIPEIIMTVAPKAAPEDIPII